MMKKVIAWMLIVILILISSLTVVTLSDILNSYQSFDSPKNPFINKNNPNNRNNKRSTIKCSFKCTCMPQNGSPTHMTCEGITSLPQQLPPNLIHLDLSNNLLKHLNFSLHLQYLHKLEILNLSHNHLTSLQNGFFFAFKNLKVLDLSDNHLTSIDSALFTKNKNSQKDNIKMLSDGYKNNKNNYVLENFKENYNENNKTKSIKNSLEQLLLSRNKLEKVEDAFEGMVKLKQLSLEHNRLRSITADTFKHLTQLQVLSLSHNHIHYFHPQALRHNRKLANLRLKHNPDLHHVTLINLTFCQRLSYLDLSDCKLTRLSGRLELPVSLRYLQLRRNLLTEVDAQTFSSVSGLNILLLDGNNISKIQDGAFSKMVALQQLWLSDNLLTSVPVQLPVSLNRLLIDNNRIQHWPENVFETFVNNKNQKKEKNNSNNVMHIQTIPQLRDLSISSNRLKHLNPKSLASMRMLLTLDVSENLLKHLEDNTFVHNTHLTSLNLNKNELTKISDGVFEGMQALETLSLTYVGAESEKMVVSKRFLVPLKHTLKRLEVDYSPQVIKAFIVNNSEKSLKDGNSKPKQNSFSLSQMLALQDLQMSGSSLQSLSEVQLLSILAPSLRNLHLTSKNWKCDEDLVWFSKWLQSVRGVLVLRRAFSNLCGSPRRLVNTRVDELEKNIAKINNGQHDQKKKILYKKLDSNGNRKFSSTNRGGVKDEDGTNIMNKNLINSTSGGHIEDKNAEINPNKFVGYIHPNRTEKDSSERPNFSSHTNEEKNIEDGDVTDVGLNLMKENENSNKRPQRKNLNIHKSDSLYVKDFEKVTNNINENNFFYSDYELKKEETNELTNNIYGYNMNTNKNNIKNNQNTNNSRSNMKPQNNSSSMVRFDEEFEKMRASFSARNIAMVIIAATVVIATFILFLILFICCRQRLNCKLDQHSNNQRTIKIKNKKDMLYFSTSSIDPKPEIFAEQETVSDVASCYKSSDIMVPIMINYPESTLCGSFCNDIHNFPLSSKHSTVFNNDKNNTINNNQYSNNSYSCNNDIKRASSVSRSSLCNSVGKVNNLSNNSNMLYNNSISNSGTHANTYCINPSKKTSTYRWEDI